MRTLGLTGTAPLLAALLAGTAAHADFQAALRDYQAGHYDAAHLAAAYAANGEFHKAVAEQQIAIQKAEVLRWNTGAMSQRLGAYRGGKPWRGNLFAVL